MNIDSKVFSEWLAKVDAELDRRGHENNMFPKADPFEHGVSVGQYQGLVLARQMLEEVWKGLDI